MSDRPRVCPATGLCSCHRPRKTAAQGARMGEAIDVVGSWAIWPRHQLRPISAAHSLRVVGVSRTSASCSNNKSGASSDGPSHGGEFLASVRELQDLTTRVCGRDQLISLESAAIARRHIQKSTPIPRSPSTGRPQAVCSDVQRGSRFATVCCSSIVLDEKFGAVLRRFLLCVVRCATKIVKYHERASSLVCPSWRETQAFFAPRLWAQQRIKKQPAVSGSCGR